MKPFQSPTSIWPSYPSSRSAPNSQRASQTQRGPATTPLGYPTTAKMAASRIGPGRRPSKCTCRLPLHTRWRATWSCQAGLPRWATRSIRGSWVPERGPCPTDSGLSKFSQACRSWSEEIIPILSRRARSVRSLRILSRARNWPNLSRKRILLSTRCLWTT